MQKKANEPPGSPRRYRAYTTEFDREITGDQIPQLLGTTSRQLLDAYISGLEPGISRWRASAEIALIEANHRYAGMELGSKPSTVATLLLDHSGSMSGQRAILAIALAEIVADYWSRIGWEFEILGFTTATWKGGQSRKKWLRRGRFPNPGRLCDLLHIVFRKAGHSAPGAPWSIRYLAHRDLLKENVDGEALEWAAARLQKREEPNKLIFVVSDGAPVDDSTLQANGADYLDRHLRQVINRIELSGEFVLAGIGLDYDVSRYYARHVTLRTSEHLATRLVLFLLDTQAFGRDPRFLSRPRATYASISHRAWRSDLSFAKSASEEPLHCASPAGALQRGEPESSREIGGEWIANTQQGKIPDSRGQASASGNAQLESLCCTVRSDRVLG